MNRTSLYIKSAAAAELFILQVGRPDREAAADDVSECFRSFRLSDQDVDKFAALVLRLTYPSIRATDLARIIVCAYLKTTGGLLDD